MEERDIVIIGAGPAGLSAALFTKPDGWDTLLLEANWVGGQGAIAYTVPNYPGFPPNDGIFLIQNMEKQATSPPPEGVGAELRREKVLKLDPEDRIVTTDKSQYKAKAIILATGSRMKRLEVPGEDKFKDRGVSYYAKLDYEKFTGKKVFVIGGGNAAAKNALVANSKASSVTLIHRKDSLRAYPLMVKRLQKEGIEVWYNTDVKEIKGGDRAESVVLVDNKTGKEREELMDWIVICVGTEPNIEIAKEAGIETKEGVIKIDYRMMTNKEGIFACGEITGCRHHLIVAASQGAQAGMSASEYLALEKVKRGEMFKGAIHGRYADEYLQMLK